MEALINASLYWRVDARYCLRGQERSVSQIMNDFVVSEGSSCDDFDEFCPVVYSLTARCSDDPWVKKLRIGVSELTCCICLVGGCFFQIFYRAIAALLFRVRSGSIPLLFLLHDPGCLQIVGLCCYGTTNTSSQPYAC
ncbi:MAG: hypothetical protein EZS28_027394 [Streblomastix strix]|uniref:Uncharacterized protein n=1 Tax=Streblomastix strix TaxID=222440 RepID=A0A5J4V2X5_9EUKA|nr:MAG: hypothetical protein EZS28_027394 [Streblomastix strix]